MQLKIPSESIANASVPRPHYLTLILVVQPPAFSLSHPQGPHTSTTGSGFYRNSSLHLRRNGRGRGLEQA